MKRTTKCLIALLVLATMCVSFCVPTFAEVAETLELEQATCPLEGKDHTLAGLGLTHEEAKAQGYWVKDVAVCGEDGYSIYKCTVCEGANAYFIDNYVEGEDVEHTFDETKTQTTAATCTADGSVSKYCTRCKETITTVIPALGHVWEREGASDGWVYSKDGVVVDSYYCTDGDVVATRECECGYSETQNITGGDHTWEEGYYITRPTCDTVGKYHVSCSVCEYEKDVDVYVNKEDPSAHDWEYSTTAEGYVAPTCSATGTAVNAVCKICGDVAATLEIAKVGHSYTAPVSAVAATCTSDGRTAGYACANCGEADPDRTSVPVTAIGHKNKVKVDAECVANSCYPGEAPVAEELVGTLIAAADAPALTEANKGWGMNVYTCPDCNNAKYVEYVAPYAHPEMGVVEVAPTHEKMGMIADACLYCGYYVSVELIPAYSHVVSLTVVPSNMVKVDAESYEPSCTVDGAYVYKCVACEAAGTSFTTSVAVPAVGHTYEEAIVPATCEDGGWSWMVCSCGDVDKTVAGADSEGKYNKTAKDAVNGHVKVTKITTTPTCTESGLSLEYCTRCDWYAKTADGKADYKVVPALGHANHETSTTPATCTANEKVTVVCKESWEIDGVTYYCNYTKTTETANTKLGHSWQNKDADGNIIGELVSTTPATCTANGYNVYRCTNDGCSAPSGIKNNAVEILTKLGHTYDTVPKTRENADSIILPSCADTTKKGQIVINCDRCSSVSKTDITNTNDPDYDFDINNPAHHTDADFDPDPSKHREATCKKGAIVAYICNGCGKDFAPVDPIKAHSEFGKLETGDDFGAGLTDAAAPATCTTPGKYETFKCNSVCGCKYYIKDGVEIEYTNVADVIIPATGHDMSTPDCENEGVCANGCGATEPALGHTEVADAAVDADCENSGLTAGSHCSVCGETIVAQTVVPALDHTLDKTLVPALCEKTGHTWVECSVCYEVLYFDLYTLALGHDFSEVDASSKAPTCLADGIEYLGCSRCDAVDAGRVIDNGIDPDMHTNAAGQNFVNSCVDANGAVVTDFYCVRCGFVAVEHEWIVKITTDDCTKYRYELKICEVCKTSEASILEPNAEHPWSAQGIYTFDGVTYGVAPTRKAPGYDVKYCTECFQFETDDGEIKKYTTYAEDGIDFNFSITNLVGKVEADGYAGRIQLVIDTVALNAFVKTLNLRVTFDADVLQFVGGKLSSDCGFTEVEDLTFTSNEASKNGYVSIVVSSLNGADVEISNCQFAVLEFQIKDTKTAGVDIDFAVDSDVTEVKNSANAPVDCDFFFAESMADAKTVVLGKLTDDGAKIGVADFNKMVDIFLAGEAGYRSEADINGDALVNAADFNIIRSYLLGNDPVELKPIV